jgi:hypothetical protein
VCAKLGEGLRRKPNLFKEIGQPRAPSRLRQATFRPNVMAVTDPLSAESVGLQQIFSPSCHCRVKRHGEYQ